MKLCCLCCLCIGCAPLRTVCTHPSHRIIHAYCIQYPALPCPIFSSLLFSYSSLLLPFLPSHTLIISSQLSSPLLLLPLSHSFVVIIFQPSRSRRDTHAECHSQVPTTLLALTLLAPHCRGRRRVVRSIIYIVYVSEQCHPSYLIRDSELTATSFLSTAMPISDYLNRPAILCPPSHLLSAVCAPTPQ